MVTTECSGCPISITDLLDQRRGRAGLHAGAAGYAFGLQERFGLPGETAAVEAAAGDGQRESALHLLAGAHAARADDAFGRVVGEIGVGLRLSAPLRVVLARDSRSAPRAGPRRRPCPAIRNRHWRRRSGSPAGDRRYKAPSRPCAGACSRSVWVRTAMPVGDRGGAGGRRAGAAVDLDKAKPAGAEGLQHVGGAELRDLGARLSAARMIEVPSGT